MTALKSTFKNHSLFEKTLNVPKDIVRLLGDSTTPARHATRRLRRTIGAEWTVRPRNGAVELSSRDVADSNHPLVNDVPRSTWLPRLTVVTGPMFAGKTSRLFDYIDVVRSDETDERPAVLATKPSVDTRSPDVRTHDGRTHPITAIDNLSDVDLSHPKSPQLVILDEAHFYDEDELTSFCARVAESDRVAAVIAGLDLDFRRRQFGHLELIRERFADIVRSERLFSRCHVCGGDAPYTSRTSSDRSRVLVGGSETYVPVCAAHYDDF